MKCRGCLKEVQDGGWTNIGWLCKECGEKPRYRYYYLNRPPSIGCQPEGFVDCETWMPRQRIPSRGEWRALGWVEYLEPLGPEQVWKWEFVPHGVQELDAYLQWREDNDR